MHKPAMTSRKGEIDAGEAIGVIVAAIIIGAAIAAAAALISALSED